MPGPNEQVAALRRLLAERFSREATFRTETEEATRVVTTGIPSIDADSGGLPWGALTEVVCRAPSTGGQFLIQRLLQVMRTAYRRVALIDAVDAFDPASHRADELLHLVWVRCAGLEEALGAADILTRDSNLALVVVDVRGVEAAAFQRVPSSTWYRLQRNGERSQACVVVVTNRPGVASAQLRLVLAQPFVLPALSGETEWLQAQFSAEVTRSRLGIERKVG